MKKKLVGSKQNSFYFVTIGIVYVIRKFVTSSETVFRFIHYFLIIIVTFVN